ncbi:hypothetical protein BUFA31_01500 [Butyricicoccus faecihominis]|uniref:Uncharacterized protein n=1 Tax=Butyricicoccus faecihominis TaxID=1712515 RepID=A0ABQ1DW67_9FIRM|nr:hypothetical protein BUFA31_01500 [Butyricicoccus faecihominis]
MNAANTALNSAFLFFIVASPLFCDINGILIYLFAKAAGTGANLWLGGPKG